MRVVLYLFIGNDYMLKLLVALVAEMSLVSNTVMANDHYSINGDFWFNTMIL